MGDSTDGTGGEPEGARGQDQVQLANLLPPNPTDRGF